MEKDKDQYDYLFKFIIIGDAGAGKSMRVLIKELSATGAGLGA